MNVSCATPRVRLALLQGKRTAEAATQVNIFCLYSASSDPASKTIECLVGLSKIKVHILSLRADDKKSIINL